MKFNISAKLGGCASSLLLLASAQAIEITASSDQNTLIDSLVIPNSGVTVTDSFINFGLLDGGGGEGEGEVLAIDMFNIDMAMEPSQIGIFTNSSGTYGLPSAGGLVFSSGNVLDYEDGPNTEGGKTTDYGNLANTEQNERLVALTGIPQHYDPVEFGITFDVSNDVSTLSFIAAFGSEEFPEFVGGSVTDGFGLFINDVNVAGAQLTGAGPDDPLLPINIDHPDFLAIEGTELDGMLAPNGIPLLRFDVPVMPGSTGNTLEFLLADAGDNVLDTTIFLSSFGNFDAASGESEFTPILPDPNNPTNENGDFVFQLPEVQMGETIWFDPDIATGYFYSTDGVFASVTAPSLASVPDATGYQLTYNDGVEDIMVMLLAGQEYLFSVPVSEFTIDGIDVDLMLNPDDPMAFVTGVSYTESGSFSVTQSPITTFVDPTTVSEPPIFLSFLLFSLLGLRYRRRNG